MAETKNKDAVVLLHGIRKSRLNMALISAYLSLRGYNTINISYPSKKMSLEELSDFVHEELGKPKISKIFNDAGQVHFTTHSMGGLITRYYLHQYRPDNLGKVVMLSPPNHGSEFADWLSETESLRDIFHATLGEERTKKYGTITDNLIETEALKKLYLKLFGPAGQQLRTDHNHTVTPKVDFSLGIIAGNYSVNPLAPWVLNKENGDHDGVVPIDRMKIDGMNDLIKINTSHTFMVYNYQVMKQIAAYLENEKFDHGPQPM